MKKQLSKHILSFSIPTKYFQSLNGVFLLRRFRRILYMVVIIDPFQTSFLSPYTLNTLNQIDH